MLSDFLILEEFFDQSSAVQFFEDLSKRYGPEAVIKAIAKGELCFKKILCGPDRGRHLVWLSQTGRFKAQSDYGQL